MASSLASGLTSDLLGGRFQRRHMAAAPGVCHRMQHSSSAFALFGTTSASAKPPALGLGSELKSFALAWFALGVYKTYARFVPTQPRGRSAFRCDPMPASPFSLLIPWGGKFAVAHLADVSEADLSLRSKQPFACAHVHALWAASRRCETLF